MRPAPQWAALVGPREVPPDEGSAVDRVVVVASTVRRRRSRQGVSRPKVVQFSLTEEEFDEVSAAAARSGLARGAFAADVTLAAARGTQSRAGSPGSLIRRNWSRNAAPAGRRICAAWPGCWPSRWRPSPVPATASRCGTARYAPPPRTVSCPMRSGRRSRPRSCTARGSLSRAMTWGCGGWRSVMPPITFTWWRRWPARMAPGPRSGTTSTGSGRPAWRPSARGPKLRTTREGWGLLTGHQRGPRPGHTRGLSHGHGQTSATSFEHEMPRNAAKSCGQRPILRPPHQTR